MNDDVCRLPVFQMQDPRLALKVIEHVTHDSAQVSVDIQSLSVSP
jgi:hypothetical protein